MIATVHCHTRSVASTVMGWSPWAEVARLPHVQIRHVELPPETGGAALLHRGPDTWILLDRDSTHAERRSRLTHELVHLERGSTTRCRWSPRSWDVMVIREELIVDAEVARRLVPAGELVELIARLIDIGEPVHAVTVAEEFEVPIDVAQRALALLEQRRIL